MTVCAPVMLFCSVRVRCASNRLFLPRLVCMISEPVLSAVALAALKPLLPFGLMTTSGQAAMAAASGKGSKTGVVASPRITRLAARTAPRTVMRQTLAVNVAAWTVNVPRPNRIAGSARSAQGVPLAKRLEARSSPLSARNSASVASLCAAESVMSEAPHVQRDQKRECRHHQ